MEKKCSKPPTSSKYDRSKSSGEVGHCSSLRTSSYRWKRLQFTRVAAWLFHDTCKKITTSRWLLVSCSVMQRFVQLIGLREKIQETPTLSWENLWFPVDFRLSQPIESCTVFFSWGIGRHRWRGHRCPPQHFSHFFTAPTYWGYNTI